MQVGQSFARTLARALPRKLRVLKRQRRRRYKIRMTTREICLDRPRLIHTAAVTPLVSFDRDTTLGNKKLGVIK